MRRTEIVARLMQCYEADVGHPLKLRFMHTILLTMENGDIKTTYVDEENATVKMEECVRAWGRALRVKRAHRGGWRLGWS